MPKQSKVKAEVEKAIAEQEEEERLKQLEKRSEASSPVKGLSGQESKPEEMGWS